MPTHTKSRRGGRWRISSIALSEMAVIRHATFLPSSSSRRIEAAVSKTRMTCGRSFGVVILIQRASSPPLMPTRSRSGLAALRRSAQFRWLMARRPVFRSAMPPNDCGLRLGLCAPWLPRAKRTDCRPGRSRPPLPALPAIGMRSDRRGEPSARGYSARGRPDLSARCVCRPNLRQLGATSR